MSLRKRLPETGPNCDYLILLTVAALVIIGLMMVYSVTTFLGFGYKLSDESQPTYFFVHQLITVAIGVVAMLVLARIEYHTWRRFSIPIMAGAVLLLGAVLVFGGEKFGGQRWLLESGSIQPGELAKLAVIIYIADWLSSKGHRIRQVTYGLIPFAILLGFISGLIILQPNFSTALLIASTAMAMFFIAGGDLWQILASGILGSIPLVLLITNSEYRLSRIISFFSPLEDASGHNYQRLQSLIALASGGATGVGLGASRQKFGYVPAAHTDNIFAILGEELGLVGCLVVVALFAFLAYRGFRVAMKAPDLFGVLLASGVTCSLIFQALINVAVVTAVVPTTGIPLPFISYGGSSMVVSLAAIGLLLSVSRRTVPEDASDSGPVSSPISGEQREITIRETHDLRRGDRRPRVSRVGRRRMAHNR